MSDGDKVITCDAEASIERAFFLRKTKAGVIRKNLNKMVSFAWKMTQILLLTFDLGALIRTISKDTVKRRINLSNPTFPYMNDFKLIRDYGRSTARVFGKSCTILKSPTPAF